MASIGSSNRQMEGFTINGSDLAIIGLLLMGLLCSKTKHLMQGWLLKEVVGFRQEDEC